MTHLEKWRESLRATRLQKYLDTPFDELGMENRRRRVFEEQNYSCNRCKRTEWEGFPIPLEYEHRDGNNQNNARENVEGLCPNCHSLTPTWRGRNKSVGKIRNESLLSNGSITKSIRESLIEAGFTPSGKNYQKAKRLRGDMK